jgi:hypothetical protein
MGVRAGDAGCYPPPYAGAFMRCRRSRGPHMAPGKGFVTTAGL